MQGNRLAGKIRSTGAVPFAQGHWQLAGIENPYHS